MAEIAGLVLTCLALSETLIAGQKYVIAVLDAPRALEDIRSQSSMMRAEPNTFQRQAEIQKRHISLDALEEYNSINDAIQLCHTKLNHLNSMLGENANSTTSPESRPRRCRRLIYLITFPLKENRIKTTIGDIRHDINCIYMKLELKSLYVISP
jgi:hypothetical protein